ncbi:Ankyrin repeat domain-containing protein [Tetrabaena socialis]|uniref:Ankyrin repeat domain-containing protein n=1 Tax=Tetrabaena socialis TaxID=47790 RepID=A0A2J8ADU5_9CHLO|nr:Ankyrin repeat domain-containing protein [Tetrabaena socialis]PNH10684.1 Ankyrin repeat domain-containing protein [Tetrabaena socialis]|eukprot:PNH01009.1 Ankyrin repeat domain-containing protein [Tetrabaena socialis]
MGLLDEGQEEVLAAAAGSPTADWRDKVKWLEGRGYLQTERACAEAAHRVDGRDRLEWLQQRGYPLTSHVAYWAALLGNADALAFLLAQGVPLNGELAGTATYFAAREGHLAALKVLHAHGAGINHELVAAAAGGGHLPVVAWGVQELGAADTLTARVFRSATESGNAELVSWLHQQACPWDASVFAAAAGSGSEEQLEWLVEHGCPMGDDGQPYTMALANADVTVLRCLRRLGCPWGPVGRTSTYAVETCGSTAAGLSAPVRRKQHLRVLTWLVEQGCPVNWAKAEWEAEKGKISEVVEWVRQLRPLSAWERGDRLRPAKQDGGSTGAGARR